MINNERQYRISKSQAEKFVAALESATATQNSVAPGVHPLLWKAQLDALRSQRDTLAREIREYEELRAGNKMILVANSWAELPKVLIQARIASGLGQRELAERLGLKEQQIQRYESTNFSGASFERIGEIMRALNVQIREELFLSGANANVETLVARLSTIGFDRRFILGRLIPDSVKASDTQAGGALTAAAYVGRMFGWSPVDIFGRDTLAPQLEALATARLKVRRGTRESYTTAYAVYAQYLCFLLLDATRDLQVHAIPTSGVEMYDAVTERYGAMSFANALRYVWSLGIPVLPLGDSGAFSGACWRTGGRNVICLKQETQFPARWLDALIHELRHAGQNLADAEFGVIEEGDTIAARNNSPEEKDAKQFAIAATLRGRAEELTKKCVTAAGGDTRRLKRAVTEVAQREGVATDVLANYVAYRLSLQGDNWWATATNLQVVGQNPWMVARDILLEYVDFSALAEPDREILFSALTETEG